jgi:N4-gp56 family major capsid protein
MVVNMKPSAADPMAQRGYVSWKTYFAACRLNESWMSRAEVAVTA